MNTKTKAKQFMSNTEKKELLDNLETILKPYEKAAIELGCDIENRFQVGSNPMTDLDNKMHDAKLNYEKCILMKKLYSIIYTAKFPKIED